jgi:hypothetical protein
MTTYKGPFPRSRSREVRASDKAADAAAPMVEIGGHHAACACRCCCFDRLVAAGAGVAQRRVLPASASYGSFEVAIDGRCGGRIWKEPPAASADGDVGSDRIHAHAQAGASGTGPYVDLTQSVAHRIVVE